MGKFVSDSKKFKALSEESYLALATYLLDSPLNVSTFPRSLTIVVSGLTDKTEPKIGEFIDKEALDFQISCEEYDDDELDIILSEDEEISNSLLKNVAKDLNDRIGSLENMMKKLEEDSAKYRTWYYQETEIAKNLRRQMDAIVVMVNSISKSNKASNY